MASIRVGTLFGIPIRLGASFLLVLPLLAVGIGMQVGQVADLLNGLFGRGVDPAALAGPAQPWALGLTAALGLFGSVFLHELGHAAVARRYGVGIEGITLWFLGGLAKFAALPEEWRQELWIAVAGPVVSVTLGVACYGVFLLAPSSLPALLFVAGYLAVLNVALAAFNMLPGFPMDGGRVLRALLSRTRSRVEATRIAAGIGKAFAVVLAFGGILTFNVFWIAIAFFIFVAATGETKQMVMEATFEGLTAGDLMTPAAELDTVSPETTLADLLDRMVRERHTGYPVLEGGDLVGVVTLEDVQRVDRDRHVDTWVRGVMSTDLATVRPETEASEALSELQQRDVGRLLVVDERGLVGLLSRTDLMTVFEIAKTGRAASLARRGV